MSTNEYYRKRESRIRIAKEDFWTFCRATQPAFYTPEKTFLKELCDTLQALYELRIVDTGNGWKIVKSKPSKQHSTCHALILQIPPRHGKSRTLVNFSQWLLGLNNENRIMEFSYNDDMAMNFSEYTRDGISAETDDLFTITFKDIFPDTILKHGASSKKKWALEGQFFNYRGVGRGGGATGTGGNIAIYDDLIKDASEAVNDMLLDKVWIWFDATSASRLEEGGIQILCGTPWSKGDVQARILANKAESKKWYIFNREVATDLKYGKDEDDKTTLTSAKMLCKSSMSFDTFKGRLERSFLNPVTKAIFQANYLMNRISIEGLLYGTFRTYIAIPNKVTHHLTYIDTADTGKDYTAGIGGYVLNGQIYINGIYYSQEPMEITEPAVAQWLIDIGARQAIVESNNGGRGFARNVRRLLREKETNNITIKDFTQTKNKVSRILSESATVTQNTFMPENWNNLWEEAYLSLTTYSKYGKNVHDDIEDALTGLIENITGQYTDYGELAK